MGDIKASPRNRLLGLLADATQGVNEFASKPFGYNNPPGAMLAGLFGLPGLSNTMNELSYGGALGTGSGMTWKPKADTVDAAMTLLPLGATAGKAAIDGGVALAKKAAPAIERAVPRVMERGGLSSQLLRDLSQNTVSPATVWHGSPHKFDKFDFSKIGTGEGAQAYGHGGYLAEARPVAEEYSKMGYNPNRRPKNMEESLFLDRWNTVRELEKQKAEGVTKFGGKWDDVWERRLNETLADAEKRGPRPEYLYKVDLPDDAIAKMLDWDKPLSQQAPEITAYAKSVIDKANALPGPKIAFSPDITGQEIARLGGLLEKDWRASAMTQIPRQTFGIPGIRYLDGGSRGTGAGTSNFVVFPGNEGLLTILERNGQPLKKPFVYPQEQALLTAQKNAALPVEQGGLGLRPDNTPMERAKALGMEDGWLHGTNKDFPAFKSGDTYMITDPAEASRYAEISARSSGGANVMPVIVRGNTVGPAEYDAAYDALAKSRGESYIPSKDVHQSLSNSGVAGYKEGDTQIVFDPSRIRSRFAAFDPMRIHENDLLGRASPGLLGLIGGGTGLGLLGYNYAKDR